MSSYISDPGAIRFAAFEVDLRTRELRKDGVKVRLEGQPFHVLAVLLDRPGQLVTREELQSELWAGETFVDFEQGINAAVKRLRVALEDSADQPRFIETLPRRGYRFIADIENSPQPVLPPAIQLMVEGATLDANIDATIGVTTIGGMSTQATKPPRSSAPRRLLARRPVRIVFAAATTFALLFLALNLAAWRDWLLSPPAAAEITSIAVLPMQNLTGDPAQEYFVDAMTEALIAELGKTGDLRVVSRTSAMAFKDVKKPLPEIARQLGVHVVLEGAVARSGDRVRITTRLLHASQERTLWAASFERELGEIPTLQNEIVPVVAGEIKGKLLN